jgi:uncharacterized damage-inducible protein DinB
LVHPLVAQLRFSRSEFLRGIDGVSADEAQRRILPMNCVSWNVGHLAWQEQRYWLLRAQGKLLVPEIQELFAYGAPASTPALDDALRTWREITAAADPWLDAVTTETLQSAVTIAMPSRAADGKPSELIFGSLLQRMLYHYWYHTGENLAIRQQLGHTGLPDFVGDIDAEAPYRSESTGA